MKNSFTQSRNSLMKIVSKFSASKVAVMGDLMLDKYLWSDVERISPEAPVPIAKVENETYVPGGAANTVYNLAHLGVLVEVVGVIGDDMAGKQLASTITKKGVGLSGLIIDPSRPTTLKTRIMSGNHQMIRFDYESSLEIHLAVENKLLSIMKEILKKVNILVISDYSKGLISKKLAKRVIGLAGLNGVKVLVDPTQSSFDKYRNSYLIKPNKKEAESITGQAINGDYSNLLIVGKEIIKRLKTQVVFITLGKDGMAVIDSNDGLLRISTAAREVYDVSGAGDTVIAALAACLSCGASIKQAATIANICGGIVVGKLGTAICRQEELITYIKRMR